MELEKGKCFCCGKTNIISIPPKTEIQKILVCLFTEKIFNINALKEYASLLKWCPSCLHKLILLRDASKGMKPNEGVKKISNTCILCGNERLCVKISDSWNHFKEISEDFSLFANTSEIIMCSGCIFYLDTRHTMKMKLCLVYPQLKEVPILKLKLKEVYTQSTPISDKKMSRKITRDASVEIIDLSSDSNVSSIDLSPLKGFTALKNDELLKKPKSINCDSKFMNQILYIKMNTNDVPSSMNINQDKNKKRQHIDPNDSVGIKLTNTRRNLNTRKIPVTLQNGTSANKKHKSGSDAVSTNKYSRIKSNADRETSETISKERNTFFKIKLKKSTKSSQTTNKQRAHKKKYMQFMEPDFNRKLIINISRHNVHTLKSSNVDDLGTGKLHKRSNIDSSMESLLIVVDDVDDERTPDDIEKPQEHSNQDTERNERRKLDSKDTEINDDEAIEISSNENGKEESQEKCELVTNNESQKDIISKHLFPEDTDSNITISSEETKKTFHENYCNEVDSIDKESTTTLKNIDSDENRIQDNDESDESPKVNSMVETDDQCTEENANIKENESGCGKNDKEKDDLNNEDMDQTKDTDNNKVNEIKDETDSISGKKDKEKDDLNNKDINQTKDTDNEVNEIKDETDSISGKNDKDINDLNNEDIDQTKDMDNNEVHEIKDETDSIGGKNDKEKDDSNNEDIYQTKDTDDNEVNEIKDETDSISENNDKEKDDLNDEDLDQTKKDETDSNSENKEKKIYVFNDEDKNQTKNTDMDKSEEINEDLKDVVMNDRKENRSDCLKGDDENNSSKHAEDNCNDEDDNLDDKDMQSTSELENRISSEESLQMNSSQEVLENTNAEDNDQTSGCNKRKCDDSTDDASSPDKKKKKVTFSDVVLSND